MIPRAKSLSAVDLAAVKYLSGAKNLSAGLSAILSAVKYLSGVKNLSAVTHISESVFIMPSDAETPEQVAANEKRLQETHAASLDVLMSDAVGRKLVQERINQLAGAGAMQAAAAPAPGPSVDTTAVLKDLVQVLADKTNSKKAKRKAKKASKNKSKRAKSGGGNTTSDSSSSSDSEDGGREDPIPQPLQRPYGKGSYDRETDDLFTQDGELSLKLLSHELCRRFLLVCS